MQTLILRLARRIPTHPRLRSKHLYLMLLVLLNSSLVGTVHYSRVIPVKDGSRYFPSTAILLVEVIKLAVSLFIAVYRIWEGHPSSSSFELCNHVCQIIFAGDSWKLMMPAALWTLQNSLVYIAVENLDAATFQITYQLRILITVIFSVVFLGKRISLRQWLALFLLTAGVAIVQTSGPLFSKAAVSKQSLLGVAHTASPRLPEGSVGFSKEARHTSGHQGYSVSTLTISSSSRGLLAVLAASIISGATGVYFEKVIKTADLVTIWSRNVQLSSYSLFPALIIGVLWQDGKEICRSGFFVGYSP